MAQTVIRGTQILNNTVQRQDLDVSTVGQAVVTKIVQGSGITLSSTGADSGTGDVTVTSPDVVSTDAGNIATLGTDNHILVPQSQIWSVRLRSFNAVGNPTFEVAQRNVRGAIINPVGSVMVEDRWAGANGGTLATTFQGVQVSPITAGSGIVVPGTNFAITTSLMRILINTQKASLAASDSNYLQQSVEGQRFRELMNDVHSCQLLVRSSVANLKFGVAFRDPTGSRSLTKLCTLGAANTITLIQLANLPVWPSAGTFTAQVGSVGYLFSICTATGSTLMSPANDTWQNGNFIGAAGQDNFLANAVNSTFEVFVVQNEPGPLCTTLFDLPFTQNYDECLRYFQKTYDYATVVGTVGGAGSKNFMSLTSPSCFGSISFPKTMAKTPTMLFYNPSTGAANSIRDGNGVDHGSPAVSGINSTGFNTVNFTTATTSTTTASFHYTADTGW